jgi:hypothetical protein
MNAIRGVMTVFMLTILVLALLGWRWSAELPSPRQQGARVALALVAVATCGGLGLIWRTKPGDR